MIWQLLTAAALAADPALTPPSIGVVVQALADVATSPDPPRPNGFSMQTVRLRVDGSLPRGFSYVVLSDVVASPPLLDARLSWNTADRRLGFSAGRFKVPVSVEFILPLERTDFARRSRAVVALAPNRDVGVDVHGEAGPVRWSAGAFDGSRFDLGTSDGGSLLYAARAGIDQPLGADRRRLQVFANGAWSRDRDLAFAGMEAFTGDRLVGGFDLRLRWDLLVFAAEYLAARAAPTSSDPAIHPVGGYTTAGILLQDPDLGVLVRLDSYSADGLAALDHDVLVGVSARPIQPVELQLNWTVPDRWTALAELAF